VFTEQVQFDTSVTGVNAENTITYIYDGENKPLLQPVSYSAFEGVIDVINEHDYHLTFEGLKVSATNESITSNAAIRIAGGPDYVTIRNCEVVDFLEKGIGAIWAFGHPDSVSEYCVIEGNEIYNSSIEESDENDTYGIYSRGSASIRINNNKIYNLPVGRSSVNGIASTGSGDSCDTDIYNNFISLGTNINQDVRIYGIYSRQDGEPTINLYHNSVYIGGEVSDPINFTTGFRLDNNATTNFYNNISFNKRVQSGGSGNFYNYAVFINRAVYQYAADHNDLYTTGENLGYFSTEISNLSDWQTATGQDANSISENPQYIGSNDLHMLPNSPVANLGGTGTGIRMDIDGELRDRQNPDIGADEFPDNSAPEITSTATTDATQDELYTYQVEATDPDYADTLSYSLSEPPAFLEIDVNSGLISGTPGNEHVGQHNVTVIVSDLSGATDTQFYTLEVSNINDPPTIVDIADQSTDEDTPTDAIAITIDDVDVDDDPADLTVSGSSDNTDLVNQSSFEFGGSGTSRTLVITPLPNRSGSAMITITVSDGDLTGTDTFVLTVDPVNDIPVVSNIPNQEIAEGESFDDITLDNYVVDEDNADSEISWSVSSTTNITVTITDRVAEISVNDPDWNGGETVTFTAEDTAGATDSDQVTFSVTAVNDAPVVSNIPNQEIAEGESFADITLDNYVVDVDDADGAINWSASSSTNITVTITDRVAEISVNDPDWNGSETVTFTAEDTSGATDSDEVTFRVTAVNDAPVVSNITNKVIAEGGSFAEIILDNYVADADDADSEISWSASSTTNITVTITDRVAEVNVNDPEWNGRETVTFTAEDPSGASDSDAVRFTVTAVNDAPAILGIPDQIIDEGDSFIPISLDNFVSDPDDADSVMIWIATTATNIIVSITDRIAEITVKDEEWNGADSVIFTVTDTSGLFSRDTVRFEVIAVNDPPVISSIMPWSFFEDDSLIYSVDSLYNYVTDVDTPDSLLLVDFKPGKYVSLSFDLIKVVAMAPLNWNGEDTLIVYVSDGEHEDSSMVRIVVNPINDAPSFVNMPDTIHFVNTNDTVLVMKDYVEDVDLPRDSLRWEFSADSDSLTIGFDHQTSNLMLSAPGFVGAVNLICKVADDSSAQIVDTIVVKVDQMTTLDEQLFSGLPTQFIMNQNFPNPFNPVTTIQFGMKHSGDVTIDVYNILGQNVATVWKGYKPAGYHKVQFNAENLATGMYLYRMQTRDFIEIRKMIILK